MKVQVLGGFLGAGKTSLGRSLAAELHARGERVAMITNDQGHSLVDTELCRSAAPYVEGITGGCFCCRYPELETALERARESGATFAIAEAVGSCTDLIATVLAPLVARCASTLSLQPLAIVVDPWRVQQIQAGELQADVAFLIQKQIEEADVVLVSRADLEAPDVSRTIAEWNSGAQVIFVSGVAGSGISEWLSRPISAHAHPLDIDYKRYATAERFSDGSMHRCVLIAGKLWTSQTKCAVFSRRWPASPLPT